MEKSSQETQNGKKIEYFDFKTSEIISEKDYLEAASSYTIESGWVRLEQKETLINDFLRPIYKKYQEIIEEVKKDIADEENAEKMMQKITLALNLCLQATRRIGVTDPNNILLGIGDIYRMRASDNNYMEYALESLQEYIRGILNQ